MFARALAKHASTTERTDAVVSREAAAAAAAARQATTAALEAVDAGPGAAFDAEKRIGAELRALKSVATRAQHVAAAWGPALDAADAALRGWGDSTTFLEATQAELARVEAVLTREADKTRRRGGGGGGGGEQQQPSGSGGAAPVLLPR